MRKRDPERTKQAISEGALRSFMQKGYAQTTMDDIVHCSGVSKGGVYWHFKGKEEILLFLLKSWMDQIYTIFQEIREIEISTEEKLRRLIQQSFRYREQPMVRLGTEFWISNLSNPHIVKVLQEIYGRYQEMFRGLLFDGMVRGEFIAFDIEELTLSFMGMIEGVITYQILMERDSYNDHVLKTGLSVFFRGIRKQRKEEYSC